MSLGCRSVRLAEFRESPSGLANRYSLYCDWLCASSHNFKVNGSFIP